MGFTAINTPKTKKHRSAMASDGAPPPPPPHNEKGNLPADKIVLPDADDEEEEESDTIVVATKPPGPLTPQASKGKGKRKRAPTAVVSAAMPDWARPGLRGDSKHRRLARAILGQPSRSFPEGSGCSDCVARSRLCVIREDRTRCASCSAQGARSCDWVGVEASLATANQVTVRPRGSQAAATPAAPAARVRPRVTSGTVRRPSSWTSPNEDLAEMLEEVEAGANPAALLRTVVGAIIELREAAHQATTVPPTNCSEEGDSGAEGEDHEKGEREREREREREVAVEVEVVVEAAVEGAGDEVVGGGVEAGLEEEGEVALEEGEEEEGEVALEEGEEEEGEVALEEGEEEMIAAGVDAAEEFLGTCGVDRAE